MILGKFIGNTSCGFISDRVYSIKICTDDNYIWVKNARGWGKCPYRSIHTLAANWEIPTKEPLLTIFGPGDSPVGNHVND